MALSVNTAGTLTYSPSVETQGLAGRMFRRREPQGDEADFVLVVGATDVGGYGAPEAELCVVSATFGAIPEGWDSATVTYGLDAFAADYTETNTAERAALALEQAAASKAATEASADVESPWSRS